MTARWNAPRGPRRPQPSEEAVHAWRAVLDEVVPRWADLAQDFAAVGRLPPWPRERSEKPLLAAVDRALKADDLSAVRTASDAWARFWTAWIEESRESLKQAPPPPPPAARGANSPGGEGE